MSPEPIAYNLNDAGAMLGVSRSSIYKLIENGELKPIKVAGRRLIPREQLLRLMQEGNSDD